MGRELSDLCRERELSFADLVARSGMDEGRVLAIYLGRWTPSPQERQQLAAVLAVEVGDVIWGHKTPIQHIYGYGPG